MLYKYRWIINTGRKRNIFHILYTQAVFIHTYTYICTVSHCYISPLSSMRWRLYIALSGHCVVLHGLYLCKHSLVQRWMFFSLTFPVFSIDTHLYLCVGGILFRLFSALIYTIEEYARFYNILIEEHCVVIKEL